MRVSLKWLQEYVDIPCSVQELCDLYDLTGTGVEGVERTGDSFNQVVVGQVGEKVPHPDSDHMSVCQMDVGTANLDADGNPQPVQLVCGAQNFKQGDKVPVALIGAVLPGDFKIKKSKLRGVTSCGMNCSKHELGLGPKENGIWILPEDAPVGMNLADYLGLSDTVLDLEITPNRPDCLSMVGMARETGAMLKRDVMLPVFDLTEGSTPVQDKLSISVEDPGRCARYTARVIENVVVGESPQWLVDRIVAAGGRSVNNVVDITNYILYLFGQPLHAFDFDAIASADGKAHISVRPAQEGEKLTTLDGEERTLTSDMTVIATPEAPIALAGVMGGLDSEVTDSTTTIVLEAATFNHAHTSRTSRNLGLISESSLRYERVVDDTTVALYADAAASLIAEFTGGTVCAGLLDEYHTVTTPRPLSLRVERCNALLGTQLSAEAMADTLSRIGCEIVSTNADRVELLAPTFRPDLEREIDLYEEVLRLYGMDNIPSRLPASPARVGKRSLEEQIVDRMHMALRGCGLNETMTYSFANRSDIEKLRLVQDDLGEAVELINPMNSDQSVLRQSIIPGLLHTVARNQAYGVKNIQLYEMGSSYHASEGAKQPKEKQRLAGVLAGAMADPTWNKPSVAFDFFDGKGVVESLMRELAVPKLRFKALDSSQAPHLQPGRAAQILSGGTVLGWLGEIHPLVCESFDCDAPVVAFELDSSLLIRATRPARDFVDIPQFPAVTIDLALLVDAELPHERIEQCMSSAGGKLLESVELFDVYVDEERLGKGKKSMAYALRYRAADRTLTSEEVEKAHTRLITKVCKATGAEIRG